MLYAKIITIATCLDILLSVCISLSTSWYYSLGFAILIPILAIVACLLVMGVVALSMATIKNKKMWNYNNKFFAVDEKEMDFLRKLKVKKWKGKVPEMGWTGGFPKDKMSSFSHEYLQKFINENCYAEVLHLFCGFLPFVLLFFVPVNSILCVSVVFIVNLVLQLLPCCIQRYVRYKLVFIYEHQQKTIEESYALNET